MPCSHPWLNRRKHSTLGCHYSTGFCFAMHVLHSSRKAISHSTALPSWVCLFPPCVPCFRVSIPPAVAPSRPDYLQCGCTRCAICALAKNTFAYIKDKSPCPCICFHVALVLACIHAFSIFNFQLFLSIHCYIIFKHLVLKRQTEMVNGTSIS